ncbi:unnamed protein product, partial [Candidula unifasciata]
SNTEECVTDHCDGKPDGNYPTCTRQCEAGFYFTCSNEILHRRMCPKGWYTALNGTRYTAPMLYVPEVDSCQLEASYCTVNRLL